MDLDRNIKVQEYLNSICCQIKNSKVHEDIKAELLSHLEDIVEEHISTGIYQEEAINKAIDQMGDPGLVGRELDRIHRLQPEWGILIITTIFTGLGLMAMYFMEAKGALLYPLQLFNRSLIFTILGISILFGLYFFDYKRIKPYSKHIYMGTIAVLVFAVFLGEHCNGMRGFLILGPISINFVGISPFLFVTALAGVLDEGEGNKPGSMVYNLALSIAPAILILMAPSFSTFIIYSVALAIMMVVSEKKLKQIVMTVACLGLIFMIGLTPGYRIDRVLNFINRQKNPQAMDWLYAQLNKTTQSAGLLGQGFNFDPGAIPEIHTDFIFTYIVYTFGWIAGIILIVLAITFLLRMSWVAMVVKDNYGKLLVSGFVTVFSVGFLWNILMNLGLAPISGVGLPFISFGGSQFVGNMAAIGIISNVYKLRNIPTLLGKN